MMGPMDTLVSSRTWRQGVLTDDDVTPDELAVAARDADTLVWIDLLAPSATDLGEVADQLGLPATAVEDALGPKERPKLIRHESHLFFTVYAVDPNATPGELGFSRISGWMMPHALVTIRLDDRFTMDAVVRRWEESPELLREGAGALVHGLLDVGAHGVGVLPVVPVHRDLADPAGRRPRGGGARRMRGLRVAGRRLPARDRSGSRHRTPRGGNPPEAASPVGEGRRCRRQKPACPVTGARKKGVSSLTPFMAYPPVRRVACVAYFLSEEVDEAAGATTTGAV